MKAYFITSCGTDIGKTFITTSLCFHLKRIGQKVQAFKPLISGWNDVEVYSSDTAKILLSLGTECTQKNIDITSPWKLKAPLAPNMAAKMEDLSLNYNDIVKFCKKRIEDNHDCTFIEGVGGVMSPITDDKTCLNLIKDLSIKTIVVVGNYLGSISHALTAISVLSDMKTSIVVNQARKNSSINIYETADFISKAVNKKVYIQGYLNEEKSLYMLTDSNILSILDF